MIRLEMDGKPFNADDFAAKLMRAAMEHAAAELHDKVSSIRHPETGEFPTVVVSGTSLEDMRIHVEGSPELLALVKERIGSDDASDDGSTDSAAGVPKVFLSYAWEDRELASRIANALQENGIDTWWAEWCITAGDSLRQKIEEGLGGCTHFVVLLTANSVGKPWVAMEIDAGLMHKLESQAKFIPLRHQLPVDRLTPLLRGMLSPVVDDPDRDIKQLINDIHGVTKKPELGAPPKAIDAQSTSETGYSAAANAVAKFFVLSTKNATKFDPWTTIDEMAKETGL